MLSETVALIIIVVCIALFIISMQEWTNPFVTASSLWLVPIGLLVTIAIVVIIGACHASHRIWPDTKTYYEIKNAGTQTEKVQIAYVDKEVIDTTHRFSVTLDNPDLYRLEKQTYKSVCDDWCLITIGQDPTYKIVLRDSVIP